VGSEEADGREVDGTLGQEVEDHREAARGASGFDAVVGLVLGEAEDGAAVGEERGMAFSEVNVADVHLGEVSDDLRGDESRAAGKRDESGDEVAVGEESKRHEQFVRHGRVVAPEPDGMGPRYEGKTDRKIRGRARGQRFMTEGPRLHGLVLERVER
jgi:hypothetical protein